MIASLHTQTSWCRMMKANRIGLLLVLVLTFSKPHAQWSNDPAVNNPVDTSAFSGLAPVIVSDGAGGVIVIWRAAKFSDPRPERYDFIKAQRFNATGVPLWGANGKVVVDEPGERGPVVAVADGQGGVVIAFSDGRADDNDGNEINDIDLYAQRINGNGQTLWAAGGVPVCTAAEYQTFVKIVADGAGGFIIAWDDSRFQEFHYYAQKLSAGGVPQWAPDGVDVSDTGSPASVGYMTSDGAGGAIFTWREFVSDGVNGDFNVWAQRLSAAGERLWAGNRVIAEGSASQVPRAIVPDGAGGALVIFDDERYAGRRIYGQRINGSGDLLWETNGRAICKELGQAQYFDDVAAGEEGKFYITWDDNRTGNSEIYAQLVDTAGKPVWAADGVLLSTALVRKEESRIAPDGSGGAVIVWVDDRPAYENANDLLYAQRVDAAGNVAWAAEGVPVAINPAYEDNSDQELYIDSAANTFVVFESYTRSGTSGRDVLLQRLNSDGTAGGPATWYLDADKDGYYAATKESVASPGTGWTITVPANGSGDCNDNDNKIYPGAAEVCNDGKDNNCNGQTDEGCSTITVTIVPSFTIEGNGGKRPMLFIVALNKPALKNISVKYKTSDGTAKAGSDYQKAEGTVSFSKGQWLKFITVNVYGDRKEEGNEAFYVQLSHAVNIKIGGSGKAKGSIVDDDGRYCNTITAAPEKVTEMPEATALVVPNLLRRSQVWRIPNLPATNQVVVSDLNGRIVLQARNYQNRHSFASLAPGTYFYRIVTVEQSQKPKVYSGKLLIVE